MKLQKLFFFIALSSCLLFSKTSRASHMMGSDITWKCLGGDSFLVTITIYRDCNGCTIAEVGGPCSTVPLTVKPSCGTARTYSLNAATPFDITPVCAQSCTKCQSPNCSFPYGIQKIDLHTVIDLSVDMCCDFNLSISVSTRNANINTGAANLNFYINAELNKCVTPCNNAPRFSSVPIQILCSGQCVIINQGAIDDEGDSLVFSLTPPLQNPNNPAPWLTPYNYDKPLYFNGFPNTSLPFSFPLCKGFHLDSITGDFRFRPMQSQITVCAFKVEEYRNGIKIGEIRRDMQWIVMNCPSNNAPVLSGVDSTEVFAAGTCAGDRVCFDVYAYDADQGDEVSFIYDSLLTGATLITDSLRPGVATFCWTPQLSDTGKVRSFTITATDDNCPVKGYTTREYNIVVFPDTVNVTAGSNVSICENDTAIPLGGFPSGGTWSGPGITSASFDPSLAGVGTHSLIYAFRSGTCTFRDTLQITVLPKPAAGFTASPQTGPLPLAVQFTDTSVGNILYWNWNFGDTTGAFDQHPSHDYLHTGTYDVTLMVEDSATGCSDTAFATALINVLVGIEEGGKRSIFLVYPNPVKNELIIQAIANCHDCRIQLINAVGEVVREEALTQPELHIQREGLAAGTYLLKLISNNGEQDIRKLILE